MNQKPRVIKKWFSLPYKSFKAVIFSVLRAPLVGRVLHETIEFQTAFYKQAWHFRNNQWINQWNSILLSTTHLHDNLRPL